MKDPYSVLNVPSTASDDEVKKAYRELARKYHPDNYHDNPLADLAQEKMKEVNEAYETIQKMRSGQSTGGSSYQRSGQTSYGYGGNYQSGGSPAFTEIRAAITRGDLLTAERLLNTAPQRTAEWHFLYGAFCLRRGYMDDAYNSFETACNMDPTNMEYREAYERMRNQGQAYRPGGYDVYTTGCGGNDFCSNLCCAYCLFNACFPCCN